MTHFKAGMSVSKLSWNLPIRPPTFSVYTPNREERGIYLCFREAGAKEVCSGFDLSAAQNESDLCVFSGLRHSCTCSMC